MADDVLITAGAGTTVATDDRSGRHHQQVVDMGASAIDPGRVNVTSTAAEKIAARANRVGVHLRAHPLNTDSIDVGTTDVASGSDWLLEPGDYLYLRTTAAIWADAASGTQVLMYTEEFN
jgi:hypothetical protein